MQKTIVGIVLLLSLGSSLATVESGPIIGIDLGTTYSCVGVYKPSGIDGVDQVDIIANDQGNRITPSYVAWTASSGERLVGEAAKHQASLNPENTVFDIKRMIGRKYDDKAVQRDKKMFPFKIVNEDDTPHVTVTIKGAPKTFAPEEISAMVLSRMKATAEAYLGQKITQAVVTVPAYFNDAQRQATKDAGTIAGLDVLRTINEPTAAAIAYGLQNKHDEAQNVLVYDLGGGTFDVTVLTIDGGEFKVLATGGDTRLGGEDFDQRVMKHFMKVFKRKHKGKDLGGSKRAVQRLRMKVEHVKRTLSSQFEARLEIESLLDGIDFSEKLTRARFESLNLNLFKKTITIMAKVLKDAGLEKGDVDEVVLVGGSTRIPKVQSLLKDFFDGKELNRGINPDEAVAYGAAIEASVLSGQMNKNIKLLDVTPISLGIGAQDNLEITELKMSTIVARNTRIPTKRSKMYTTLVDDQKELDIKVFEGERALTKHNHLLGQFTLSGIEPAPAGKPEIEVTFEIDVSGITTVTAKDKGTGHSKKITVTSEKGRLRDEELQRMFEKAEEHAEEDKLLKEKIAKRNELESKAFSLTSTLDDDDGDHGLIRDRLDEDDATAIETALESVLEWLDDNTDADVDEYEKKHKNLERVTRPIMRKLADFVSFDD